MAITYVGKSAHVSGTGILTVAWPAGHQARDVAILIEEREYTTQTVGPSSWTYNYPQWRGAAIYHSYDSLANTSLTISWTVATSSAEPAAVLGEHGQNHRNAVMLVFRGCDRLVPVPLIRGYNYAVSNPDFPNFGYPNFDKDTLTIVNANSTKKDFVAAMALSRDANSTNEIANWGLVGTPPTDYVFNVVHQQNTNSGSGGGVAAGYGSFTSNIYDNYINGNFNNYQYSLVALLYLTEELPPVTVESTLQSSDQSEAFSLENATYESIFLIASNCTSSASCTTVSLYKSILNFILYTAESTFQSQNIKAFFDAITLLKMPVLLVGHVIDMGLVRKHEYWSSHDK